MYRVNQLRAHLLVQRIPELESALASQQEQTRALKQQVRKVILYSWPNHHLTGVKWVVIFSRERYKKGVHGLLSGIFCFSLACQKYMYHCMRLRKCSFCLGCFFFQVCMMVNVPVCLKLWIMIYCMHGRYSCNCMCIYFLHQAATCLMFVCFLFFLVRVDRWTYWCRKSHYHQARPHSQHPFSMTCCKSFTSTYLFSTIILLLVEN